MKRTSLPPTALGRTEASSSQSTHSHGLPSSHGPEISALASGPNYQDMADKGPQVQAAEIIQMAADALAAPAVGGPVVQGWFLWKGKLINDQTYAANKNDLDASLITAKLSQEMKKQGARGKAAAAELESRIQAIKELAMAPQEKDDELASARDKEELIRLAKNQIELAQKSNLSAVADTDDDEAVDGEVEEMMQTLLELGAFPQENVVELARQATQRGFRKELELAHALATNYAEVGGRVQCGVLRGMDPITVLGKGYSAPAKRKGQVGADIVVWFPTGNEQKQKTTFIQSKATNEGNMKVNAIAAANQLAGKNASGTTGSNSSAVKEYTYEGDEFERVVFVSIMHCADIASADRAAAAAFNAQPKFVSKVVIEVESEPAFYAYLPGKPYVRTVENPLLGAKKPLGQDEKEHLLPPAAKGLALPAPLQDDPDSQLETDTQAAVALSLGQQPAKPLQNQPYREVKVKDNAPNALVSAAADPALEENLDQEEADHDEEEVDAAPAAAAVDPASVTILPPAKRNPKKKRGKAKRKSNAKAAKGTAAANTKDPSKK